MGVVLLAEGVAGRGEDGVAGGGFEGGGFDGVSCAGDGSCCHFV